MSKSLKLKLKYGLVSNQLLYDDYFTRLKNIAVNIIKWDNLPKSVSARMIELCLFDNGYVCYFNDDILGNLCLPCVLSGDFDIYGIPSKRQVYSLNNEYNRFVDNTDSVLIFNNSLLKPTCLTIDLYARKLANIDNAINVNINATKTPCLILCSKQQELTLKNIYNQYEGNEPVIFGDETLDIDNIKSINTNAPITFETLQTQKQKVFYEALNFLGIPTDEIKRERLTANESVIKLSQIEAEHNVMLNERKKAVDLINNMFGTDINVSINMEIFTNVIEEVFNNEQIHDIN